MRGIRLRGFPPVPGLSNFLELNVRTYVHDDEGLPGVWFFSLDASNAIACSVARARFHLPYFDARMRATHADWIDYACQSHHRDEIAAYRYRATGEPRESRPRSLDFFLVERYDLFAHDDRTNRLFRGRVHHRPYLMQGAEVAAWSPAPLAWDGLSFPARDPDHLAYSKEAKVEVFGLVEITKKPGGSPARS
jgi:uncharacterized protein YqjF (DUF2071 family)